MSGPAAWQVNDVVSDLLRFPSAQVQPVRHLQEIECTVIGLGAIGRPVSQLLATLGIGRLQLIDFDKVERSNMPTQGYSLADLDEAKVEAAAAAIRRLNPQVAISTVEDRFRPTLAVGRAVFCCVDSIAARSAIWRAIGPQVQFWADGRLSGDVLRVLAACNQPSREHYGTTLVGTPNGVSNSCATNGSLAAAAMAASLMVHQFTRWAHCAAIDADTVINLAASEWTLLA